MEIQGELMLFTLFVCLGAGIFGVQGLLAFFGKADRVQTPALAVSLASVAIGGVASFLHLEHWERIFNGFGHLTSGITQELIGIVIFCTALIIYFAMIRRAGEGKVPKWCGIMAMVISVALVIVMAHSYNMAARPAWDTPVLWFYYLANALLFGGLTVMLLVGVRYQNEERTQESGLPVTTGLVGGIAQAVMTVVYAVYFMMAGSAFTTVGNYFDPTHPTKAMQDPSAVFGSIFAGSEALVFWLGAVAVGSAVPVVLAFMAKRSPQQITVYAAIGLAAALIGALCFRYLLYALGFSVFVFY